MQHALPSLAASYAYLHASCFACTASLTRQPAAVHACARCKGIQVHLADPELHWPAHCLSWVQHQHQPRLLLRPLLQRPALLPQLLSHQAHPHLSWTLGAPQPAEYTSAVDIWRTGAEGSIYFKCANAMKGFSCPVLPFTCKWQTTVACTAKSVGHCLLLRHCRKL